MAANIEVASVNSPVQYKTTPWLLLFSGIIGLYAAFTLTQDKFAILEDPNFVPSCS